MTYDKEAVRRRENYLVARDQDINYLMLFSCSPANLFQAWSAYHLLPLTSNLRQGVKLNPTLKNIPSCLTGLG